MDTLNALPSGIIVLKTEQNLQHVFNGAFVGDLLELEKSFVSKHLY